MDNQRWGTKEEKPVNYTVVIAVDSELQTFGEETEREVKAMITELSQEREGLPDVLVFSGKPLKLKITTVVDLS